MTLAWVVGSHGLLGSALARVLAARGTMLFVPSERFNWTNSESLSLQLINAVQNFSIAVQRASTWEIYWAAGIGTMSSSENALFPETIALGELLELIKTNKYLSIKTGAIGFSSSAGAIYGACEDDLITEMSLPAPNSAYGRAKLRQEAMLHDFSLSNPSTTVLLARISTLYGVGQTTGKQQGLLTHMARNIIRNKPIGIYVPIDTIRDYIWADDAASDMIDALRSMKVGVGVLVKIIASEQPMTIAEIISIFRRVTRRPTRVNASTSAVSALYKRRIQFRSIIPMQRRSSHQGMPVGIARIFRFESSSYVVPAPQAE